MKGLVLSETECSVSDWRSRELGPVRDGLSIRKVGGEAVIDGESIRVKVGTDITKSGIVCGGEGRLY
jgi:hypothetical protein